jgi:uroporphyrin-3 C-methyltransferase
MPVAIVLLAVLSSASLALAWTSRDRIRQLESELAQRQQESAQAAAEARALARAAETTARDAGAKMALLEARVAETVMQRSQLEDLIQSMARSRDENVLADVEAAVRVAMQQTAITGSPEPLLAVLRQADERLARYNQPRLERVRRAIAQDLERSRAAGMADLSVLTIRLDEIARQLDDLPLATAPATAPGVSPGSTPVAPAASAASATPRAAPRRAGAGSAAAVAASAGSAPGPSGNAVKAANTAITAWLARASAVWDSTWAAIVSEVRSLVRVSRIETPEAMLVAPEQGFFLRENLKLRVLNARLALLSRQFDTAQSDLREAQAALERWFERGPRRTAVIDALRQVQAQARGVAVPRPDATLAAITTALAGR